MPVITCKKCPCELRVRDDSDGDGDTVRCPNCGHVFKCSIAAVPSAAAEEIVTCYVPDTAADGPQHAPVRADDDKTDADRRSSGREGTEAVRRPREPDYYADLEPRPRRRSAERDDDEPRPSSRSRMRDSGSYRRRRSSSSGASSAIIATTAIIVAGVVFGVFYVILTASSKVISKSEWKSFEEPNRFKVLMPGSPKRVTQQVPGGLMVTVQLLEYDRTNLFLVATSEEPIPREVLSQSTDSILNSSCDGTVTTWGSFGGVEKSRESIQLGKFPGKQVVADFKRDSIRFISRVYLAHDRLYIVAAAGKGYTVEHENVTRFFNSFEITEAAPKVPKRDFFLEDPPQGGFRQPPEKENKPPRRDFGPQRPFEKPAMPGHDKPDGNEPPIGNGFEPEKPAPKKPRPVSPEAPPGTRSTKIHGGHFDSLFRDVAPEDGVLVGLEAGLGKFVRNDIVVAVRPIYRVGNEEKLGNEWGSNTTSVKVIAKPGYAIGAITVKAGLGLDGFSVTFMKIGRELLNPKDAYESEWIGGTGGGGPDKLAGDGWPIVGIVGKTNQKGDVTGIGLIERNELKRKKK